MFYFWMAIAFAASAVIGFAPNSLAILEGTKSNPHILIHIHAATMVLWLGLLVSQTGLTAFGRTDLHKTLGISSFVLAPVVGGLLLLIAMGTFLNPDAPLPGVIMQAKRLIFFFGCIGMAIAVRKRNSEAHKRLMFIGTFAVLDAAFFRMQFLPGFGLENSVTLGHLYMTGLLFPFLIHDLVKHGRIHIVYWITIPPILFMHAIASQLW